MYGRLLNVISEGSLAQLFLKLAWKLRARVVSLVLPRSVLLVAANSPGVSAEKRDAKGVK